MVAASCGFGPGVIEAGTERNMRSIVYGILKNWIFDGSVNSMSACREVDADLGLDERARRYLGILWGLEGYPGRDPGDYIGGRAMLLDTRRVMMKLNFESESIIGVDLEAALSTI
jgi:hypothetical protein